MLKIILIITTLSSLTITLFIYKKLKELRYGIVEHFSLGTVIFFLVIFTLIFGILIKLIDAIFITIF